MKTALIKSAAAFAAVFILTSLCQAALWSDCSGDENGWKESEWFGWFWSQSHDAGWLYHGEHEWLCAFGGSQDSVWFWHPAMGWLWTRDTVYPFLWSHTGQAWLFYYKGSKGWFLNFNTGEVQWRGQFPNEIPEGFALIPAGEFQMGDSFNEGHSDELPVHTVYVSAFHMGVTEVTNEQMREVMQWAYDNGKVTATAFTVQNNTGNAQELLDLDDSDCQLSFSGGTFTVDSGKENYPCVEVSWYGSAAYANYKSEMEGLQPCYNLSDWTCNFSNNGYRLPTEAEWEKAARGGLAGQRFPWGDTITHNDANYYSDSDYSYDVSATRGWHPDYDDGVSPCTSPVGSFAANGYGLYDMAGNVWEWCWDRWDSNYYDISPGPDPAGPDSGSYRVFRGGGWVYYAIYARCASRHFSNPSVTHGSLGFRLARSSE